MSEIRVEKVRRTNGGKPIEAGIMAGNVLLSFAIVNGKLKLIGKSKPESRIYDPAQLEVPKVIFAQACRQAMAIFRS